MVGKGNIYQPRSPLRWRLVALILLAHLALGALLMRLLAPDFTARVVEHATSSLTVIITSPPPPSAPDRSEAGMAGDPGQRATAREVSAPDSTLSTRNPMPVPPVPGAGTRNASGAEDSGLGTGAAGTGDGTGSGAGGQGRGSGLASGPSVLSGSINSARDFPIPPGGRQVREGTSVTVVFTVGVDGRAYDCSVASPGPDPATNALVCQLVIERIRFNPARDASGNLVPARYGWRQDFARRQ